MNECLQFLAKQYPTVKFCKLNATSAKLSFNFVCKIWILERLLNRRRYNLAGYCIVYICLFHIGSRLRHDIENITED